MILDVLAKFIEIVITCQIYFPVYILYIIVFIIGLVGKVGECYFHIKIKWVPTNLVFSQLKEYPISLNCYEDIYP